jgi:hypothetical protein
MMTRLRAWWHLALGGAASLTSPPADVGRADREFDEVLRESVVYQSLRGGLDVMRRASSDALVGMWTARMVAAWRTLSAIERLRRASITVAVAGATACGLQTVGAREPFAWVLPLVMAAIGATGFFAAPLLVRAVGGDR